MFRQPEKKSFFDSAFAPFATRLGNGNAPSVAVVLSILAIILGLLGRQMTIDGINSRTRVAKFYDCNFSHFGPYTEKCYKINDKISSANSLEQMFSILAILGFLACAGLIIRALNIRANSGKAAPNHQIALDFFENNPTYPMDREKVTINCPITLDVSNSPVCISYDYNDTTYSHAYDYNELIEWFKTEKGKSCPATNIPLLEVKNFTMSFDIPGDVPEKILCIPNNGFSI